MFTLHSFLNLSNLTCGPAINWQYGRHWVMGTRRTQPYPRGAQGPVGTVVGKHKEDRNMDPEPAEDALSTVIKEYKKCFWGK